MTAVADEARRLIAEIDRKIGALREERTRLTLGIEESEGRPDSHAARFARAELAGDVVAMEALCVESIAAFHRTYGEFPQEHIRQGAIRLLALDEDGHDVEVHGI